MKNAGRDLNLAKPRPDYLPSDEGCTNLLELL